MVKLSSKDNIRYRVLLIAGFSIWILSVLGDLNGRLPEATYGMLLSMLLTAIGLYFWFKAYKAKRGHYPKFLAACKTLYQKMLKNPFTGFLFPLKHILKLYSGMLVFSMVLISIGHLTIGSSKPVRATQNYCENNPDVVKNIGTIKHYGIIRNVQSNWNALNLYSLDSQ